MKQKIIACVLCVALLPSLFSCEKKETDRNIHDTALEEWSPEAVTFDREKAEKRQDWKSKLAVLPLANENAFSTEETADGIRITSYDGTMTAFRIPDRIGDKTVSAIGEGAFSDRTDLTAVAIPESVTEYGDGVFKGCNRLEILSLPLAGTATQYFGYLFGSNSYQDNAKDLPASLKLVSICNSPEEITDYCFYDCNDLICIVLPESVKSVGKFAFCNDYALEEINVDHLVTVGQNAFCNCMSLERMDFGSVLETLEFASLEGCSALRSLTVPFVGGSDSENGFLGYVFGAETPETAVGYYPSKLMEITVLDGCSKIGNNAFYRMQYLQFLTLPDGVGEIGIRAFDGCVHLCEIVIPSSVRVICENAFVGCLYLKEVTFQDGSALSKIGINAFYNCRSLKEIKLPETLTSLPNSCFAGCDGLETVDFGGVKTVGTNAFRGCVSIKTVTGNGITFEEGNDCVKK